MERIDWELFSDSHARISEKILELKRGLDENVHRHIQRGFWMRLGMMESAITTFDAKIGNSTKPLSNYLVFELSLLLNGYYLNLVGSFDNLAWALTYHHKLLEQIDEDNNQHRHFANISGNKFLKKLRDNKLNQLADKLETNKDWLAEVKKFRDPAAHRIPLYIAPSQYSQEDLQKRKSLDEMAAKLTKEGNHFESASLTYQIEQLGTHLPYFFTQSSDPIGYFLPKQINEDHKNWLKLVKAIFEFGFNAKITINVA